jgi:hypothetical protein
MTPDEAVDVLFRERHRLAPDILRSLQDIWNCASAARYGEPCEDWAYGTEFYAGHDTADCEDDGAPVCICGAGPGGCEHWKPTPPPGPRSTATDGGTDGHR